MRTAMIFTSALFLFVAGCRENQQPQKPQPPASSPKEAASSAIQTLQQAVTAQNFRALGFESADEVKRAALGQPLTQFDIGLDQLKSYKEGANVNSLLSASADTIFPVTVNGQVRSAVIVSKREGGYVPATFGRAEIVKALSRFRQQPDDFVIRIPALNMYFVGRRVENHVLMTPIIDDPRIILKTGAAMPAEEVLKQLVPVANAYNGLPM